jgi:hypothetical protein
VYTQNGHGVHLSSEVHATALPPVAACGKTLLCQVSIRGPVLNFVCCEPAPAFFVFVKYLPVLRIRYPVLFRPLDLVIRDGKKSIEPGSGIGMNIMDIIFENFEYQFLA